MESVKYGPQYFRFDENCLKQYGINEFHGSCKDFDYSRVTMNKEEQAELNNTEKQYLGNIIIIRRQLF